MNKFAKTEEPATAKPLTEDEADEVLAELLPCVDAGYQGQGAALHGVRKVRR